MTLSSNAPWSRGPAHSLAGTDSGRYAIRWSRWSPKAVRTSRSRLRRSAWSSPAASATSAFAIDVEWTLLSAIGRLGRPDGTSSYFRLSTRPVDQTLAAVPADPAARERRRRQAIAGGYVLRRAETAMVTLVGMGAMMTETLDAADRLVQQGVDADVVCVTSPGLLFSAVQARRGLSENPSWILEQLFPAGRSTPMVTVLDGHPHTLAFLTGINGVPGTALSRQVRSGGFTRRCLPIPRYRHRQHCSRRAGPG